jgi:hypothetical protein
VYPTLQQIAAEFHTLCAAALSRDRRFYRVCTDFKDHDWLSFTVPQSRQSCYSKDAAARFPLERSSRSQKPD